MALTFTELLTEIQGMLSKLEVLGFGGEDDSATYNGVTRGSIANSINQQFLSIKAMIQGQQSFETKVLMDADLNHDENVIAIVWKDATQDNNGLYGKNGASGSGSWSKSSYDDYTALRGELTAAISTLESANSEVATEISTAVSVLKMPWGTGYLEAVIDDEGYVLRGIKEDLSVVSVSDLNPVRQYIPWHPGQEFSVMLIDDDDTIMGYYSAEGKYIAVGDGLDNEPWQSGDLVHAVFSDDDILLHGYDDHGALVSPGQANWPVPYLKDNSIYSVDGVTLLCASGGNYDVHGPRAISKDKIQAAWLKSGLYDSQRVTTQAQAGYLVPDDFETLHIIISYGQSLSVGAQATDLHSITAPYDNDVLMFDGDATIDVRMGLATLSSELEVLEPSTLTGFQNLVSKLGQGSGSRGQTICESMGHELSRAARHVGTRWHGLFFNAGLGGTAYSGIKKGTQPYANLFTALDRAIELATEQGLKVVVDAIAFVHGEADAGNETYANDLIEMQSDLATDIKARTNQMANVPLFMNQPSSFFTSGTAAAKAFYEVHKSSDQHILVAPNYDLAYAEDLTHLTGAGYFMLGERFYNSFIETMWRGKKSHPLMPDTITRNATEVKINYLVPSGEIEIDTTLLADAGQFGFEFYNDVEGVIAINTIVKTAANELTLTLASAPASGNSVLRYGLTGHSGSRLANTAAHGNIRDSSTQSSRHQNQPLHNWGVHFEEII